MDISNRLIAPTAKTIDQNNVLFDLDAFIRHLLLFDHYILDSFGLLELPALIDAFTFDGFLEILKSGVISINCFAVTTGSLSPSFPTDNLPPGRVRPLFHYSFAVISTAEPYDSYDNVNLLFDRVLPRLNLKGRQTKRLRKAIYTSLAKPNPQPNDLPIEQTARDLFTYPQVLPQLCALAIKKRFGKNIPSSAIKVIPTQLAPKDFKVQNNLQSDLGFNQLDAHKIIESALLSIVSQYDRLEMMRWHSAITGFSNEDYPLFEEKINFLFESLSPEKRERRFQRVIEIKGLPRLSPERSRSIDAHRLLEIRESPECITFRHWLTSIDEMTDQEVSELGRSISDQVGMFVRSTPGRVLRFLATTALGIITPPGIIQAAPITLSALDTFLFEKVLAKPSPTTFIDEIYPSIFRQG